jgi:hypothetical protein
MAVALRPTGLSSSVIQPEYPWRRRLVTVMALWSSVRPVRNTGLMPSETSFLNSRCVSGSTGALPSSTYSLKLVALYSLVLGDNNETKGQLVTPARAQVFSLDHSSLAELYFICLIHRKRKLLFALPLCHYNQNLCRKRF